MYKNIRLPQTWAQSFGLIRNAWLPAGNFINLFDAIDEWSTLNGGGGGGGGGTVTATAGNLTLNGIVLGAGTVDTKVVTGITTDGISIINLGVSETTIGKIKLFGNTSGDVTVQPTAAAGTATVQTLPATTGTLVNRVTTAAGVSASNSDGALTFTLGAITPTTVNGHTFTTGSSTFTGSAAQVYTFPTTTATIARTDAAQTFTGVQTFGATSGSTLTSAALTSAVAFTVGNSSQTLTLGGSSGTVTVSSSAKISISSSQTDSASIELVNSDNSAASNGGIRVGNLTSFAQTSGSRNYMDFTYNFSPASGTAVHNQLAFTGTLNQTGGANGIIRGIQFAHTMSAVADYRAIEIADNLANAKGIYQSGALTTNNFVGRTRFGAITAPTAQLNIDQTATATGARTGIVYTGAVNTNQTLSTEIPAVTFTTAGREWATGAIATQREVLITQPTYSFVGASTITNAATLGIAGAPIRSTNATHTNSHALLIQAGSIAGAVASYGLTVNAQVGGTANYAAQFMGGNVGVGVATPSAKLHIAAGSATALTAPLKFTSGALTTGAEIGAVEYLTDSLYVTTTTGTTRRMIVAGSTGRATGQVALNASVVTFTTPAVDGTYEVSANVLVTTSSAESFSVRIAYTDESNTARTQIMVFTIPAGTTTNSIAFANGAVPYAGVPSHIRCKASTAITVQTAGTFTGCTYNVEGVIKQIA